MRPHGCAVIAPSSFAPAPRLRQLLGCDMWLGGVGMIGGLPRNAQRLRFGGPAVQTERDILAEARPMVGVDRSAKPVKNARVRTRSKPSWSRPSAPG
jgi:hypothetical protein